MNVTEYLNKVAYITSVEFMGSKLTDVYQSIFDDSYITHVGMEDNVKYLADREITEELTHGVGFSPKDNKWYGWSHRAIYGFTIGSTCKKGDCHYQPDNKETFIENCIAFWSDPEFKTKIWPEAGMHREECVEYMESPKPDEMFMVEVPGSKTYGEVQDGVWIKSLYNDKVPNEKMRLTETSHFHKFPDEYGRGEWTAKTMEDAKQMAIDFNEGVS